MDEEREPPRPRSKLCPDWERTTWAAVLAFWFLGLFNNSNFVIMNAAAKEINAGGVGWVYFANVFPVLLVKGSAPYWFHLVPYAVRVWVCVATMVACLLTVGYSDSTSVKFVGVGIGALQSGLGEATVLALSSRYRSELMLTAWSSGTGFAGIYGYAHVVLFNDALELPLSTTLAFGLVIPLGFALSFFCLLPAPDTVRCHDPSYALVVEDESHGVESANAIPDATAAVTDSSEEAHQVSVQLPPRKAQPPEGEMTSRERFRFMLTLWPYMVPLFVVYTTEYAMQAGTWAAIGFPVTDEKARKDFYLYANWTYQVGVFISRSSGTLFRANRMVLWVMPVLQTLFLVFFTLNAALLFWMDYGLLVPAFGVGLLGGAVYVNAYTLIAREVRPKERVELALGGASIADTFGILIADLLGLVIQGCLYSLHDITDGGTPPSFTCGHDFSTGSPTFPPPFN